MACQSANHHNEYTSVKDVKMALPIRECASDKRLVPPCITVLLVVWMALFLHCSQTVLYKASYKMEKILLLCRHHIAFFSQSTLVEPSDSNRLA